MRIKNMWGLCVFMCVNIHGLAAANDGLPSDGKCHLCEPNTFCFQEILDACPLNAQAPAGSSNIADCVCIAGYHSVSPGHDCSPCPAGSYCTGDEVLRPCPAHILSSAFAETLSACFCVAGYSGTGATGCVACSTGEYKPAPGSGVCEVCDGGTYSDTSASIACTECPLNTSSAVRSGHSSACVSIPGFFMAAGAARACVAGSFQPDAGKTGCVDCREMYANSIHTYYTRQEASVSALDCVECPAHSQVQGVSSGTSLASCECRAGYTVNATGGSECVACAGGTFKSLAGSAACVGCSQNTFASGAAVGCTGCPVNSSSGTFAADIEACVCDTGFGRRAPTACEMCVPGQFQRVAPGAARSCEACAAGFYSSDSLQTSCQGCAADTFQNTTGATKCLNCPSSSTSGEQSTSIGACDCLPGYGFQGGAQHPRCEPCLAGSFKNSTSNSACSQCAHGKTNFGANHSEDVCVFCMSHQYIEDTPEGLMCVDCVANSGAQPGGVGVLSCLCDPGFTAANGQCVPCPVGAYKGVPGNGECTRCAPGFEGADASLHPGRAAYVEALGLDPDLRLSEHACVQCQPGAYELEQTCVSCPPYSFVLGYGALSVSSCECVAGYSPALGVCAPCVAGTYKLAAGSGACTACPADTFSAETNATDPQTCAACPANTRQLSEARDALSTCVCKSGYTDVEIGVCVSCAPGSFKRQPGAGACESCPVRTFYDQTAPPFVFDKCVVCPDHSTAPAGSASEEDCVCSTGFSRNASVCAPCLEDFYCPRQNLTVSCPVFSRGPAGAHQIDTCVCVAGYHRLEDRCVLCPVNTYCPGGGAPVQCPANASSETVMGSTNISACVCSPGFHESNATCVPCARDTYCTHEEQIQCPANSSSVARSASADACQCDALFRKHDGLCELCPSSMVCHGGLRVTLCAHEAYNMEQRCVCVPGTFCTSVLESCTEHQACQECPADSHCEWNNETVCPRNSTSAPGSHNISFCHCLPGFYRDNAACLLCPVGSYCANETRHACALLDGGLTTLDRGAQSADECLCVLGDFRLSGVDLCKPCPRNFFCPSEAGSVLPNVHGCLENEYTLHKGSHSRTQCMCDVGFLMVDSEDSNAVKCMPCRNGERCAGGAVVDEFCHLENRVANAAHDKCICKPGFEETPELECRECVTPTIKPSAGDLACVACAAHTFWMNASFCAPCPANSSSVSGSSACTCHAPLVMRDAVCVPCAVDTFFRSANECQACPRFSDTLNKTNAYRVDALGTCVCGRGFSRPSKPGESLNQTCVPCPPDTYELDGTCVTCGDGAVSAAGSAGVGACRCNATSCAQRVWNAFCAGSCEAEPQACTECRAGKFKDSVSGVGNTEPCEDCAHHSYQERTGASVCDQCDATRYTLEPGTQDRGHCLCVSGHEHVAGLAACRPCEPGHFKTDTGDYNCSACVLGTYAVASTQSTCQLCSEDSPLLDANTTLQMASDALDDCTCDAGYFLFEGASCLPCVVGSFKDSRGTAACQFCGTTLDGSAAYHHTYGVGGEAAVSHTHCVPCPPNAGEDYLVVGAANPMGSVADCHCKPGHDGFSESAGCQVCPHYQFKMGFTDAECGFCEDGYAWESVYQECTPCELSSSDGVTHRLLVINGGDVLLGWGRSQADCACAIGYTRVADECVKCALGEFRNVSTDPLCSECGLGHYQDVTGATSCKQCPAHSFTLYPKTTTVEGCLCDAGREWETDSQSCEACPAGKFNAAEDGLCEECANGFFTAEPAQTECQSCAQHEHSVLPRDAESTCVCDPGHGGEAGSCVACAYAKFSAGGSTLEQRPPCAACPEHKNTSDVGRVTVAECSCVQGYGTEDAAPSAPCVVCVSGKYAAGGENTACKPCGFGTITEPELGARHFDQCMCNHALGLLAV